MRWETANSLKWIEFSCFDRELVKHGVFTRHGGVSPSPWASLNLGGTVGDEKANVIENKRRLLSALDIDFHSVFDGWQVHSTTHIRVERPRMAEEPHPKADILVSNIPGITLMMRFADCVPLMVYDPVKHAVGVAHAGWKGTMQDVAGHLIRAMEFEYGSKPADMMAAIGPSICQKHYQVGVEVIEAAQRILGSKADDVIIYVNQQAHIDLWQTNRILLEQAGILEIEQADLCTFCDNRDWFSHRAEKGNAGRFGAVIQLQ